MDKRFYIGGNLGLSRIDPDSFCPCMTIDKSNDLAVGLFAGVDISKRFSLEAHYSNLGAASVDFLGDRVGTIDYSIAGLSGVFYVYNGGLSNSLYKDEGYFSREGLSVYAKFGVGVMDNESELDFTQNHGTHLAAGVGLEYGFSNGFAIRAELNSYDSDAQQINASIMKRFGDTSSYAPVAVSAPIPVAPTLKPATPKVLPVEPLPVAILESPVVYFQFGRAELTQQTKRVLDGFIAQLLKRPELAVHLAGHTDSIDTVQFNQKLSLRRTASVKTYLRAGGINAAAITQQGYGELQPIASNATDQGRALNRRVEVTLR